MAGLSDVLGEGGGSGDLESPGLGSAIGGGSNKELMAEARMSLSGNWGMAVLGYFLYMVLMNSIGFFTQAACIFTTVIGTAAGSDASKAFSPVYLVAYLFLFLISGPAVVGFCGFFLCIVQDGEANLERLFVGFRRFGKSVGAYFFYLLFFMLWYLLLVIPAIIAGLRYSMAFFIIADDEDCGPLEAIRRSKEMMVGNKWKLFCMHWRFLGWALLATIITFGIGYLWLVPYMQTSFAKFYEDVK